MLTNYTIVFFSAFISYCLVSLVIMFIKSQSCYRATPLKDEKPFWEKYSWAWIMGRLDDETRKFYAWSKFYDNLPHNASPRLIYTAINEMENHSLEVENLNDLAYKKFLHEITWATGWAFRGGTT